MDSLIRIDYTESESSRLCVDVRDVISLYQEILSSDILLDKKAMQYLISLHKSLLATWENGSNSSIVAKDDSSFRIKEKHLKSLYNDVFKVKRKPFFRNHDEEQEEPTEETEEAAEEQEEPAEEIEEAAEQIEENEED